MEEHHKKIEKAVSGGESTRGTTEKTGQARRNDALFVTKADEPSIKGKRTTAQRPAFRTVWVRLEHIYLFVFYLESHGHGHGHGHERGAALKAMELG